MTYLMTNMHLDVKKSSQWIQNPLGLGFWRKRSTNRSQANGLTIARGIADQADIRARPAVWVVPVRRRHGVGQNPSDLLGVAPSKYDAPG
jgi:hypothetical protein